MEGQLRPLPRLQGLSGKAPKLQPTKYKAEFVWDRVHNGFRSMPPWKELYKPEEVIALVAWVMSEEFWPVTARGLTTSEPAARVTKRT